MFFVGFLVSLHYFKTEIYTKEICKTWDGSGVRIFNWDEFVEVNEVNEVKVLLTLVMGAVLQEVFCVIAAYPFQTIINK